MNAIAKNNQALQTAKSTAVAYLFTVFAEHGTVWNSDEPFEPDLRRAADVERMSDASYLECAFEGCNAGRDEAVASICQAANASGNHRIMFFGDANDEAVAEEVSVAICEVISAEDDLAKANAAA